MTAVKRSGESPVGGRVSIQDIGFGSGIPEKLPLLTKGEFNHIKKYTGGNEHGKILFYRSRSGERMRIRYCGADVPYTGYILRRDMEVLSMGAEVLIMTTLLTFIVELALVGIVLTFLPQILIFVAVCFSLACIFSLVTGIGQGSK